MNIGFVGLGKLGLPCAMAIESKGHRVVGYDVDPKVAEYVRTREIPYVEAGAPELLKTTQIQVLTLGEVVRQSEIIFVAVQTPHEPLYEGTTRLPVSRADFDYSYLKKAMTSISNCTRRLQEDRVVIIISTVLPGTVEKELMGCINAYVKLCYNPFFIAMGTAIDDFLNPEFVLFGVDDRGAADKAAEFYQTITNAPFFRTTVANAEAIKVFYNTYISTKIAFANTIMEVSHKCGLNSDVIINALSLDKRRVISPLYLRGGMGDGGGCHPRDNIALSWLAGELDLSYDWFGHIMLCREKQTEWFVELIQHEMELLPGLPFHVLGKAFKANIGLTIGSPASLLVNLLKENKIIPDKWYDPHVDTEEEYKPERAIIFIATQHKAFMNYQFIPGSVIIDPFNYISHKNGIRVISVGRQAV